MIFYKFQACSTLEENIDRLESIIREPTLYASSVAKFNDPFEFKVSLEWPKNIEETRKKFFDDNPSSSESDFKSWFEGLTSNNRWFIANRLRIDLLNKFAVCCLTQEVNNHLLWAHYAKNHEGFCVGYDISAANKIDDWYAWGPVDYGKTKERFNLFQDSPEEFLKKACFHKSDNWEYEKEYRILFNNQGKKKLPQGSVKEIYLGCRSASQLRKVVENSSENTEIDFYQMCEDAFEYSLHKQPIKKGRIYMSSTF